jgi:hypothetical protein
MENNYELEDGLIKISDILPLLEIEAKSKNLQVFTFTNEDLKQYYTPKNEKIGIVLLAKNKDNALFNLKNLRKCYAVKI